MKVKIILAGLLSILFTSCNESFLDIPSEEALTTTVYFQTENDFQAAVNGTYAAMRQWFGSGGDVSTTPLILIGDIHSDNSRYALNPNYRATTGPETSADFVPETTMFSSYWNDFYNWISRCNQIISRIDEVEIDADAKANLKGQALFMRAYSYWWLVRLYGDAILHLDPVSTLEETSKALSPEADIKAQIILDASEAAGLLPGKAAQEAGRVTSGTAYMLLADLHMWYGEWAEAETALKNISGYSLMDNYADVFDPANKNNSESLYEIQFSSSSSDYASYFTYMYFPYPTSADVLAQWTGISNPQDLTRGEMFNTPTPELISAYEDGDERFAASIMYIDDANGVTFPMCIKYLHTHSTYWQSDDNLPIYRYSEVLLYLAEAANEQGRTSEAQGYLNQVRNRAGLENTTAATQTELRDAIINERQVEFAFEGKRWWDLVRTGRMQEVISAYGARVIANPENYYFQGGYLPVASAFTDTRTKFELPDSEKLYNPNID
ncbi:RagB/SusD family nutrient uptake outer membrane protein [uncultured Draconibacterium sp.]|uniref:RagB/SusD family nutrient uptake outer membrane protein n=1 Tax=uncultured Draconibacterium sp. TaxID=1573823 RepID=UPI002AA9506B|nr:RagB/SusD family nutrient uptake outer membrane protein [uncultured Draconibacterium sp.]